MDVAGDTVGGNVTLARNAVAPGVENIVEGNTIGVNLSCVGNTPAPTDVGTPNTVTGIKSGQCVGL